MRLATIPFDRGTNNNYPFVTPGLERTGLVHVSDFTKTAVKAKIDLAQQRAQSLDNTTFDTDKREGHVHVVVPDVGDVFETSTAPDGTKTYSETLTSVKRNRWFTETSKTSESYAVSPNQNVIVAVQDTSNRVYKAPAKNELEPGQNENWFSQSFQFNLDGKPLTPGVSFEEARKYIEQLEI